jgi:hypothetical protein
MMMMMMMMMKKKKQDEGLTRASLKISDQKRGSTGRFILLHYRSPQVTIE